MSPCATDGIGPDYEGVDGSCGKPVGANPKPAEAAVGPFRILADIA